MGRKTTLDRYGGKSTALGHVRGLGAAQEGPHHWLLQRFTAVGNFLLGLYLVFSFVLLPDLSYEGAVAWLSSPVPALAVALFLVSTFWHARLGLQVLIEDYVHTPGNKFAAMLALNLFTFAGAAAGLFFVFMIVTQASSGDVTQEAIRAEQQRAFEQQQMQMQQMQQMQGGGF